MKIKDYNSTDATLRRQHLDKWHKFTQIADTSRKTQSWRVGKLSVKNAAFALPTPAPLLKLSLGATTNLRLLGTGAATLSTNEFPGLGSGDLITFTSTTNHATAFTTPLTLEVSQVFPADGTIKSFVEFKSTVGAVSATYGTSDLTIIASSTASVSTMTAIDPTATVSVPTATIDSLSIKAHGIPIYNGFSSKFYNAYIPYHFGGPNVNTPQDSGALMVNFNLYPGTYQPYISVEGYPNDILVVLIV